MNRVLWVGIEHLESGLWPAVLHDGHAVLLGGGSDSSAWRRALCEQAASLGVVARDWHQADLKTVVGQCRAADLIRQRAPLARIVHCLPRWDSFDGGPNRSMARDDSAARLREVTEGVLTISQAALATLAPGGERSYTLLGQAPDRHCGPVGTAAETFVRSWVESTQPLWHSSGFTLRYLTPQAWLASRSGGE